MHANLVRVNDAAKRSRQTRFTALFHHLDIDALERAFGQWLKQRLPWLSTKLAEIWRHVFQRYGLPRNDFAVDFLGAVGPTVLYALAAPSTPEEVREEIENRAAAGEKITVAEVEQLKREAGIHRCDVYFPQLAEIQPRH